MSARHIAIISFPGSNCETETVRAVARVGMHPKVIRWNQKFDPRKIDGYVLPGGFSFEDRGRAGMIATHESIFELLHVEASVGKPIIGICNGAQMLVESGLVPLPHGVTMSLAKNTRIKNAKVCHPGFINRWVHIKVSCGLKRCCASDCVNVMHMPIAHGEGRFTTNDKSVFASLMKNDQVAFMYCDAKGNSSPAITPNGSAYDMAGICNPEGNVVAMMPHPERSSDGDAVFRSFRSWLEGHAVHSVKDRVSHQSVEPEAQLQSGSSRFDVRVYIDTKITNNEEQTVQSVLQKYLPQIQLRQLRYFDISSARLGYVLSSFSLFNPNKEIAYIERGGSFTRWNPEEKIEEVLSVSPFYGDIVIKKTDREEHVNESTSDEETGICYVCSNADESELLSEKILRVFANPHASVLQRLA